MYYAAPTWRNSFGLCSTHHKPIPYASLCEYLSKGRDKKERPLGSSVRLRRVGENVDLLYRGRRIARVYPGDEYEIYNFNDKNARRHLLELIGSFNPRYSTVRLETGRVPQLLNCYFNPFDGMKVDSHGFCLNPPVLWRPDSRLEDVAQAIVRRLEGWRVQRNLAQKPMCIYLHVTPNDIQVRMARFVGKFRALLKQDLKELGVFSALAAQHQRLLFMFDFEALSSHEALRVLDS